MPNDQKYRSDYLKIQLEARKLSDEQVEALEKKLAEDPDDIDSRVKLCSYYFDKHCFSRKARKDGFRHVKWFIRNHPTHPVIEGPEFSVIVLDEPDLYEKGKALWLEQIKISKEDPLVLRNAASYFALRDKVLAVELIEKLRKMQPANTRWLDKLAHQYRLGLIGEPPTDDWLERTYHVQKELVEKDKDDVYTLSNFATIAAKAGYNSEAKSSAQRVLEIATPKYEGTIHEAHSVLGLLQIENGDIEGAKKSLYASGPWPEFDLANKLIEIGEIETVCDYLWKNLKAWKIGKIQLLYWISILKAGKKPELKRGMLLSYGIGGYYNEQSR